MARKKAATALEELLERHLPKDALTEFRKARQQHAKLYQIEEGTNLVTGRPDPQAFRKMRERGEFLSGKLDEIANAAMAMPEVMRNVELLDTTLMPHLSDMASAGVAGGAVHLASGGAGVVPAAIGGLVARPAALALGSSKGYQNVMANVKPKTVVDRNYRMGDAAAAGAPGALAAVEDEENPGFDMQGNAIRK
jgi:hypothetical protein